MQTAAKTMKQGLEVKLMMGKATVNLQDSFLNQVRKDNSEIEMVLVNGTHLSGLVRGFDNFTVVVNAGGKQHLVYKHAIAQIVSQRPIQEAPVQQPQQGQAPFQPREPREQREPSREQREPREQRDRRPQPPRGDRPQRAEGAPEREHGQGPRPRRDEQQQQPQPPKDKFNKLDFSEVKIDQDKS